MEKLRPAQIVIVASGLVAFVASFLPWVDFLGESRSAWSEDLLFPTFAWVGIAGAAMAIVVLLDVFTTVRFPAAVLGFTMGQVHRVLALLALVIAVSFLIGGEEFGVGFWLSLLSAIGLMVGAVMLDKETPTTNPGTTGTTTGL